MQRPTSGGPLSLKSRLWKVAARAYWDAGVYAVRPASTWLLLAWSRAPGLAAVVAVDHLYQLTAMYMLSDTEAGFSACWTRWQVRRTSLSGSSGLLLPWADFS